MDTIKFDDAFKALTRNAPFPWQRALYDDWFSQGKFPASCNLPTGLGKTSVIAVWLIALANKCPVPKRLVYVVNRRTVVDQTTDEVETYRKNLSAAGITEPLALSTLRGQFADNREWSADPSRPAVICGTVDMIGSRLLFSGYGVGMKAKPLHAGFLGQDALLVHDEAHLEPAFQTLLLAIRCEQRGGRLDEQERCVVDPKRTPDFRPMEVMELTATSRGSGEVFGLEDEDRDHPTVRERIFAKKTLHLDQVKDPKKLAEELAAKALEFRDSNRAVLVFARTVDDVMKIRDKLPKDRVKTLTGTMRGKERDELVEEALFRRFMPGGKSDDATTYLVCTSAGEVGVNISADHLVCDLSTFDSMAQRFGRVNRFGQRTDTAIHVIYPDAFEDDDYDQSRELTLTLLRQLNGDGSPHALGDLDPAARRHAFAPPPTILPATDILFDAWALTTIAGKLPGRPPVEPYLHGISDYDPPQTTVAWREEVELLTKQVLALNRLKIEDVLDLYPLKPHEELSGPTYGKNKVFEQLEDIAARDAKREPDKRLSAWVIDPDGTATEYPLEKLVEKDRQNKPVLNLGSRTVILPPRAGGFRGGLLDGETPFSADIEYDVSDHWYADKQGTVKRRVRVWESDEESIPKDMRRVIRIDFPASEDDEDAVAKSWHWYVRPLSADEEGSKNARVPITWQHHTDDVTRNAEGIVDALQLDKRLIQAVVMAARFHDLGKMREVWQRSIGNPSPKNWHAKSGPRWRPIEITDYRHEFGSLMDILNKSQPHLAEFQTLSPEMQDLVLHLVAVHHGRGRPHFPADEAFDPSATDAAAAAVTAEVPRRFAKLQRTYGRWGLAYLESLLRAADYAASANPSRIEEATR